MSRRILDISSKLLCVVLSIWFFISAIQHFINYNDLDKHYQSVNLGTTGRFAIGTLQAIASFGFFFTRTRKYASLIFAVVMIIAIVYSLARHSNYFPFEAFYLLIVSAFIFISASLLNKSQNNLSSR